MPPQFQTQHLPKPPPNPPPPPHNPRLKRINLHPQSPNLPLRHPPKRQSKFIPYLPTLFFPRSHPHHQKHCPCGDKSRDYQTRLDTTGSTAVFLGGNFG